MSEGFGARWSRLKREKAAEVADTEVAPKVLDGAESGATVPSAQISPVGDVHAEAASVVAELPAVETLTPESDFAAFMQPKVPDVLRRQALKKLFADPHFNTMDGLDVYIDDYNTFTPIPEDWYKDIPSWQKILNPQIAIVTDKGYAVEPDSEEGKAFLAAQALAQEQREADAKPLSADASTPLATESTQQVEHPAESDAAPYEQPAPHAKP